MISSTAAAIQFTEQLERRFTINNTVRAPSLAGQDLKLFAKSVHKDLTRGSGSRVRSRPTNTRGMLRYLVNKEAEQIGTYNYHLASNFAEVLMKIASDQDKERYKELADHVNDIFRSH
ncbi:unnamed protein product [Rhizophagus irregularis]|uniref:Uncharacterized protein n=1 Tax=Rhizophagus irregularis TaxID=588596 RepID=A0A2I1G374_9GLOM|nr:hypothetical protein RhiirA4_454551 [Rhizophagus irregularis]CAB4416401.1 unnamed protein product [Rhizophagus irregularis]CAB4417156.1 unnamed protein product [Rhizophagus irregularis]